MKLLVLGCNGMVGSVVSMYLDEHGHEVLGYDVSPSAFVKSVSGSLSSVESIRSVIKRSRFDAIINCTAIINQDAEADKAGAVYINSYLPHFLEDFTADTDTIVVHRSTDCIFSGKRGQYRLDDFPDAESFYARTKSVGELNNKKDITIRTSLIGPETDESGSGLFNWFIRQSGEVTGFAGAIWTGVTTLEFAREIEWLLQNKAHGLFHCVPNHAISKYELLLLFEKYFPANRRILRVDNARVDKSLVQSMGDYEMIIPDYEDMIADMAIWLKDHHSRYTNYCFTD